MKRDYPFEEVVSELDSRIGSVSDLVANADLDERIENSLSNLKRQFAETEAFVKTSAYRSYLKTIADDIVGVEASILATPPVSTEAVAHLNSLFGRRAELASAATLFEDAQATLRDQIIAIDDLDSQAPDKNER